MAALHKYKPLRLMAGDVEDLNILSACLQDAVTKIGDLAYLPEQRRFAFVANRFVWEASVDRKRGPFARVRAGIHFDDVLSVQQQNLRAEAKDAVLSLLSLRFEAGEENGSSVIMLDFAGGGSVRLEVEAINAQMNDISEPWRTRSRPDHQE